MSSKYEIVTRSKVANEERNRRLSIHEDQSDSSDADSNPEEVEEEMDVQEYRKFLSKIFPSKYLDKKIKDGEKQLKLKEKGGKKIIVESDSDESLFEPSDEDTEDEEDIEDTEDEDDEEEEEEEEERPAKRVKREKGSNKKPDQINICLQWALL